MPRLHIVLVLFVVFTPYAVAVAQDVPTDSTCRYDQCAVWLDRSALRRGANAQVILRDGFVRPMRLTAFVGGSDSATVWAERFERRAQTGAAFSSLGLLSVGIGIGTHYFRTRRLAPGVRDDANGFEAALSFGGVLAWGVGLFVRSSAEPARGRAVWWYNRRFAR